MVALILLIIWGSFFLHIKKKIRSGYVYFFFLGCMLLPASIGDFHTTWLHEPDLFNIIIFSLCLIIGFLPWLKFDEWSTKKIFFVPNIALKKFKVIFIFIILLSLYSIIYFIPFVILAFVLGAAEVRTDLYSGTVSFIPNNIFTTIAAFGAGFFPIDILFFFISCLSPELRRYRIWLAISSSSYIFNLLAVAGRDALIFVPSLYFVFYLLFANSMQDVIKKKVVTIIKVLIFSIFSIFIIFSLSRFYNDSKDINELYSGIAGYIVQQPYVFDDYIQKQDDFWGFEARFPLVNRILGIDSYDVDRTDNPFEWSFGTMYAEHFSTFGWWGLILITMSYVFYYWFSFKTLIAQRKTFGLLLLFSVFAYIAVSGMFYTHIGISVNTNLFYFSLSILPFFVSNLVRSKT